MAYITIDGSGELNPPSVTDVLVDMLPPKRQAIYCLGESEYFSGAPKEDVYSCAAIASAYIEQIAADNLCLAAQIKPAP